MLAEALQHLAEQSVEARTPHLLEVDGVRAKRWIAHGSQLVEVEVPPGLVAHKLLTTADVLTFLHGSKSADVFVSASGVDVLLDRDRRDDRVSMDFVASAQWQAVAKLLTGAKFDQKAALRFLRVELQNMKTSSIVTALKNLTFARSAGGTSVVAHGRESLGRQVEAAVTSSQEIPEVFVVTGPLWANPGLRHVTFTVDVDVSIDVEEAKIEFSLHRDAATLAIERGVLQVRSELMGELQESGVRVFAGKSA